LNNSQGVQVAGIYAVQYGTFSLGNGTIDEVYLGADSNGGQMILHDASNNYGAILRLVTNYNSEDHDVARIESTRYGGRLTLFKRDYSKQADLYTSSVGAQLELYEADDATYGSALNLMTPGGESLARLTTNTVGALFFMRDRTNLKTLVTLRTDATGGYISVASGSANPVGTLRVNSAGAGSIELYDSNGTITISEAGNTGNITCVSLTQTSSRKVKKNIKPIKDAKKILELEAVQFDYKEAAQGKNKRGFIAEDVVEVLPNLVTEETEDTPATLDYMQMIPYLQAVIKDQEARIKALEDKLKNLEV
jgi:hypothetical protein